MFDTACDSVLTSWAIEAESYADFIEAYRYTDSPEAPSDFRTGHLEGSQISRWLNREPPAKVSGGFRLLICERHQYSPLDFPITHADFRLLQRVFHLPASTLATFDADAGSFSQDRQYRDLAQTELERVGVVIKAPQKREIGNYGLSCSYDVSTSITTALLYGTNVPHFEKQADSISQSLDASKAADVHRSSRDSARRSRSRDVSPSELIVSHDEHRHSRRPDGDERTLVRSLRLARAAWTHPLLLASAVLTEHMRRTKLFCNAGKVMHETWAIEGELGVTYIGRWIGRPIHENKPHRGRGAHKNPIAQTPERSIKRAKSWAPMNAQARLSKSVLIGRAKAEELTVRINTQSLRILFTARSPQWNSKTSQAMRELLGQLGAALPGLDVGAHHDLRELLEYNVAIAESVGSHVASMKERMALQLDVLYSMVAQMDNRLSARLAASAGRDSTSMKILAFITAVYLPAQAVATFFGMSMFAWPHSGDNSGNGASGGEESIVSNWFWLYWAVTVPLTVITLGGWGLWWVMEMRRFRSSYSEALGEADDEASGQNVSSGEPDLGHGAPKASNFNEQELRRRDLRARLLRREPDEEEGTEVRAEKANGR